LENQQLVMTIFLSQIQISDSRKKKPCVIVYLVYSNFLIDNFFYYVVYIYIIILIF